MEESKSSNELNDSWLRSGYSSVGRRAILESELMPDPLGDRKINTVPRPPNRRLSLDRVFRKTEGSVAK